MRLIDTSCWIEALRRKGDSAIRAKVQSLLQTSEAAWCDMVRLELWNGATSEWDKKLLRDLEATLPSLPMGPDTWNMATDLAVRSRSAGHTIPATDLLIFACARSHGVEVEHKDHHFEKLEQLK